MQSRAAVQLVKRQPPGTRRVIEIPVSTLTESQEIQKYTTAIAEQILAMCPLLEGWTRGAVRGGVLCNGSVTYESKGPVYHRCVIATILIRRIQQPGRRLLSISAHFGGWAAEYCDVDKRYYAFDTSYTRRDHGDFQSAVRAIDKICLARTKEVAGGTFS